MKTINMKTILKTALAVIFAGTVFTSCTKKEGCTDPAATNFNVEAEADDGSCTYATPEEAITEEVVEAHITFNFTHHFDGVPVTAANFNQFNFVNANGDTLSISKLRYLVSDVKLYRPDGSTNVTEGYNLVDVTNNTGLSYSIDKTDLGALSSIGFNFGFDTTDNAGTYVDLNSATWGVPVMMGGGYHGMQFEGMYKNGAAATGFAYHHIVTKRPTMMDPFEANHIEVSLPGIALNNHNVVVEVRMNIAEWFKTPNAWELDVFNSSLMSNYTAQTMMKENGYNVFTLGIVSQKQ
jgi:hypothetical protein